MDQARIPDMNPQQKNPKPNRKRRRIDSQEDELKLKLYTNPWKINKRLKPSDLNGLSRLIIPTDQVITHVLPFMTVENQQKMKFLDGIRVPILDLDSWSTHTLTFKKWPGSNSYVLVSNWNAEFVNRKMLREGQEIGMIWDKDYQAFYFKVIQEYPRPPPPPPSDLVLFGCELSLGLPGTGTGQIQMDQDIVIAAKPLQCRPMHISSDTACKCEIDTAHEDFAQAKPVTMFTEIKRSL